MSTKLSAKAVGSSVYLKVNGTKKEFIVVHQGLPSSLYDSSCNGTWLLMKEIYLTKAWDSTNNDYANSDVHSYLNNTFLGLLESNIKAAVKQVKLPYRKGTGSGGSTVSGSSGLSTKIFLLSGYECGWTTSDSSYFPVDGAKLSYFTASSAGDSKRIAYYSSTATKWWLRSPVTNRTNNVYYVGTGGDWGGRECGSTYGVRPALVLPSSLSVSDDGNVQTNTAPTTPPSITVPESIMGGTSVTVSWEAATDADGNLEGYELQRSLDGGTNWVQVYQASATSTTNTVIYGTTSVMYRVRAYDSDGEYSGWTTSEEVVVVNNTAPSAPPAITVPNEVKGGGTLTITWSASADAEDNIEGYKLERSIDGGDFTQIYSGNTLSYTDTITKGWSTVAYRVCAYDPYTSSEYIASATRTVDNNTAPTITCEYASGTDLGVKTAGFSITYSVDDVDSSDAVTVTEKMDGTVKRTYTAEKGADNSFDVTGEYFQKLLNGSHTMEITATDGKATVTYTLTFTKLVTAAVITLAEPMEADAQITICAIAVAGNVPEDAEYKIEVTNNGKDATPVWEDCTSESKSGRNYLFTNETATSGFAFNFRITAKRGSSGTAGYISSIQGGFQ